MSARARSLLTGSALSALPVAFLGVFFAWPVIATVAKAVSGTGLGTPSAPLPPASVVTAFATTVLLGVAGTIAALVVGLPAAWALHRFPWRGSRLVDAALSAPFVLPTMVVSLAVLSLQRQTLPFLGAFDGVPAIIVALAFFNIAVVLRFVGPAFEGIDEKLIAAARTLGASSWQAMVYVIWAQVRRAIAHATAVTFLFCATSFALVLILGGTRVKTLETSSYLELTTFLNVQGAAVLALVQTALIAATLAGASRLNRPGWQPAQPLRIRATRHQAWWIGLLMVPAVAIIVLPSVSLVVGSLRGTDGWTLAHYGVAASTTPGNAGMPALGAAALQSILLAIVATTVTMLLAAMTVAAGFVRPQLRWLRVAAIAPLAVSSVMIGLGLLLGLGVHVSSGARHTTAGLIVAAQVLIALPIAVRLLGTAVDAVGPGLIAAARTLGAHGFGLARRVILPLITPALASSLGIAFAISVGEFGASVFLARPNSLTLPTAIARALGRPGVDSVGAAMAAGVILGAIAAVAMMLAHVGRPSGTVRQLT